MVRCPTCGRRIADAAPVCPVHGAAPPAPPPAPDAGTPYVVPTPQLPAFRVRKTMGQGGFGAVFLADRVPDGEPVAIKVARADNVIGQRGAGARGGRPASRSASAARAGGLRARPPRRRRGVPGHGVRARAHPRRPAWRSSRAAWTLDEFARHALALLAVVEACPRARAGPLRSQARERVRRSDLRRQAVRLRPGAEGRRGRDAASKRPRRRRPPARPSTCRPSSARGGQTSTRAATSTRWAPSSTRC